MADKKEQQFSAAQMSEISTIRNILMGEQMAEYQDTFNQIHSDIEQVKVHFAREIDLLSGKTDERLRQLEKDMSERFDRLEKLLAENVQHLDEKLVAISKNDKNDLGKMMAELSKKLISE